MRLDRFDSDANKPGHSYGEERTAPIMCFNVIVNSAGHEKVGTSSFIPLSS